MHHDRVGSREARIGLSELWVDLDGALEGTDDRLAMLEGEAERMAQLETPEIGLVGIDAFRWPSCLR